MLVAPIFVVYLRKNVLGEKMKDLDKDIEKCLEINIDALVDVGYIKSKQDLSEEELVTLKKVIEHSKGLDYNNKL